MSRSADDVPAIPTDVRSTQVWHVDGRQFRRIEATDIEHLRVWRNEQQAVLRQQHPIDVEHQQRWYREVVMPSYEAERPSSFLVVCAGADGPTSYGGLTNIDWVSRRGELSFLAASAIAADEVRYEDEFTAFLQWVIAVSFDQLHFRRLFTETWSFREEHMRILESAGLRREGRLRSHVVKDGVVYDALIHGILRSDRDGAPSDISDPTRPEES